MKVKVIHHNVTINNSHFFYICVFKDLTENQDITNPNEMKDLSKAQTKPVKTESGWDTGKLKAVVSVCWLNSGCT